VASHVGALAVNERCLCCHVLVVMSLLSCICCHVFVVMSLLLPQSSFKHKRLWLHRQLCTSASLADARLCVCVRVRVWNVFARQALGDQVSHLSVTAVFDMCLATGRIGAQVVLCAGAIESPKLLLLSGIGDREELLSLGIACRVHSPQVGRNLQVPSQLAPLNLPLST